MGQTSSRSLSNSKKRIRSKSINDHDPL